MIYFSKNVDNYCIIILCAQSRAYIVFWVNSYCSLCLTVHYSDAIMGATVSKITIVYSNVYSGTDQRKHQSSASLAFVRGIHRWPVNSPHKWSVTRKIFPFDDVTMPIGNGTSTLGNGFPDSKVHGANMGLIWVRQDPGGPHVGPMNLAIWLVGEQSSLTNNRHAITNYFTGVLNTSDRT